jgi:2-hydroxy fatty acid dioxygenase
LVLITIVAFVLAPFFVHLELLFKTGYRKDFSKEMHNAIGVEVAQFRKQQGDKKRAEQKSL